MERKKMEQRDEGLKGNEKIEEVETNLFTYSLKLAYLI